MATTTYTPSMLRGAGTRGIPEIPAGSSFTNTYSLDFDGINDYVDCGNDSSLQITGALTVSFWFKSGGGGGTGQATVTKDTLGARCWAIWTNDYSAPLTNIAFSIFNSNVAYGVTSASDYNDGNWHNVVCIFTPSTSIQMYVDGILDGSNTTSIPATIDNDAANVIIGGIVSSGSPIYEFNGNIDEVAIFNSAKAIGDLWDGTGQPTDLTGESGIVSWWRMGDDATYPTIPDEIGSNNGTMTNMASEDIDAEVP